MRRSPFLLCLALFPGLLLPAPAQAQTRERVKIVGVRLGLPLGPFNADGQRRGIYKAGQWAPVYIDLECTKDTEEALQVVVETVDADDAITEGTIGIGPMAKGDKLNGNEMGRLAYLKPGKTYSEVKVRVKGVESGRTYGESSDRSFSSIEGPAYVVLGVGHNLNGFRLSTGDRDRDRDQAEDAAFSVRELRGGWVVTSKLDDVGQLPDQWFGYGAVDVMVIGTGADQAFWLALAAPQHEKRRRALAEWVRRGGRVVLSTGTNLDVLEALKEIREMLPATIPPGGKRMVSTVPFNWRASGVLNPVNGDIGYRDRKNEFAVANLQARADRPTRVILSEDPDGKKPLAVQGPYGQGRVTVVGFDLDRAPFSEWSGRTQFWENVIQQTGYPLPGADKKYEKYGMRSDEYTGALQGSLDYFEGVPVVSFGWVALFILIYIVLIGPVDYLFLKKVVKRLEWTWVTFPVIVITVSAGAYFAAYALKGKDLKINKVDVVDIDLAGKRMDGNSWFTLFSPRIHNYTIGVEPAGGVSGGDPALPRWTPAESSDAARNTVLSWQSNVETNRYGGGGGFFSKKYRYQSMIDPGDPNRDLYAAGLEGVPIQVWTTKAFAAQWTAPIDPEKPPVIADLAESRAGEKVLVGTVTNNLPVPANLFTDHVLVWRGKVFQLNGFPVGVPQSISLSAEGDAAPNLKTWIDNPARYQNETPWQPPINDRPYAISSTDRGTTSNPAFRLWPVLFAEVAPGNRTGPAPNAALRRLDQSWRVAADRPEQAILLLRVATAESPAEDMTRAAQSPSRLWLGELPTSGKPRPALQGTLKQETYVRVFIPVKPARK